MKYTLFFFFSLFTFFSLNAQCTNGDCINGTGTYVYPSGAKYTGQFQESEIHGIGVCYYSDGSIYRGNWKHRFPHGRGTKIYADGRQRKGKWYKGQPVDDNGNIEVEALKEDIKESATAEIQAGCIKGNCTDGQGILGYPNGSRYEGQFIDSKPDGWGTFVDIGGEKYVGAFRHGRRHGNGTVYYNEGHQLTGEWREGEFYGSSFIEKGRMGCVAGNCEEGNGTYIYQNGEAKYIGDFSNGVPNGQGAILYSNGNRYTGSWANGRFDGKGTLYPHNGKAIAGWWKAGSYMGKAHNPIIKPQPKKEEYVEAPVKPHTQEVVDEIYEEETNTPVNTATSEETKVWAVLVGVANYSHMPTLRYTDDDAYRMHSFFKSPEGGALSDDQITILIDEDATKTKIEKAMQETFAKADENDLIVLYFSGHGLNGAFIPIDFDGFNNRLDHTKVNELFEQSPAKYKLCIADACHSGSLFTMKSANTSSVLESYYKNLSQAKAGTALIMSSKSEETSLESSGLRQGVFSHFLIRGLKGEADIDNNKIVTVSELYKYISKNVVEYTGNRQTPVIQGNYDRKMSVSVVR